MHISKNYQLVFLYCFLNIIILSLFAQTNKRLDNYNFSAVERTMQSWMDSDYTGASIWIAKDNRVIYKDYFGNYTSQTVAYIASASKWLAAATIAAVVDEGKGILSEKAIKEMQANQ